MKHFLSSTESQQLTFNRLAMFAISYLLFSFHKQSERKLERLQLLISTNLIGWWFISRDMYAYHNFERKCSVSGELEHFKSLAQTTKG